MQANGYPEASPLAGAAARESMRELDDIVEQAIRRNELFAEAEQEIDALTVTERSPDGAVEVTVRSSGALVNLSCSELIRTMNPRQLSTTIQHCVQAAQAGVSRRVEEILRGKVPDDPLTDELVAEARNAFPPPPAAAVPAPSGSGPRSMPIGK